MSYYPSVIARANPAGFAGRYIHNADSPEHFISLLLHLHRNAFRGDLDAMQMFLVNQHPGGWSQLGTNPTEDTGWDNSRPFRRDGFVCYCHGDRHEVSAPINQNDSLDDIIFVEWLYVLDADGIGVSQADWSSGDEDDPVPAWRHLGRVGWVDGPLPEALIAALGLMKWDGIVRDTGEPIPAESPC